MQNGPERKCPGMADGRKVLSPGIFVLSSSRQSQSVTAQYSAPRGKSHRRSSAISDRRREAARTSDEADVPAWGGRDGSKEATRIQRSDPEADGSGPTEAMGGATEDGSVTWFGPPPGCAGFR